MQQNRRYIITLGIFLVIIIALGLYLSTRKPEKIIITENFEEGMEMWIPDSDVPMDPNRPGQHVNWTITLTQEIVYEGTYAAKFVLDGRQDDGTIWLEQEVSLEPNTKYNAEIKFQFWSASESFNQLAYVVGQASPVDLKEEGDFADLGAANLVEGWRKYTHKSTFLTDDDGLAYIGYGVSVVWETEIIYFIDQVEITITPT